MTEQVLEDTLRGAGGLPGLQMLGKPARTAQAYNHNHVPAGSPEGGQFAPGDGGDGGASDNGDASEPSDTGRYLVRPDNGTADGGKGDGETKTKPDMPKDISKDGADFIKNAEGSGGQPNLNTYPDAKGNQTIGWGHKMSDSDRELYKNGITEDQADKLFKKDIQQAQEDVQKYVKVDLNQEQYDALVSFSYQLGAKQFRESDAVTFLNEGKYDEAADALQNWGINAPGALPGDIKRREGEANRFRLGTFKKRVKSL